MFVTRSKSAGQSGFCVKNSFDLEPRYGLYLEKILWLIVIVYTPVHLKPWG